MRSVVKRRMLLATAVAGVSWMGSEAKAQWQIDTTATTYTLTFDVTVAGVNNGQYAGTGFQASPTAGQLDSDAFAVTGWSNGSLAFGGTQTTANTDYTRGASSGGMTTGGMYAYTVSSGNVGVGFQPGGSDWAPGTFTLRILNNTGSTVSALDLSYKLFVRNNEGRANSFNFSWSTDDTSYTAVSALDYTSPAAVDANGLVQNNRSTTLTGLTLSSGSYIYLRWSGADISGSGSRDEFVLDDISISMTAASLSGIQYFDTNGSAAGIGGSGAWDTLTANWNSSDAGTGTPAVYDPAKAIVFGGTGNVVSVSGTISVESAISFTADGYTIQDGTLQLAADAGSVDVSSGLSAAINSAITGSGGLTKTSAGTLSLGGSNSYTGGTMISEGTLAAMANGALPGTGELAVNGANATLDIGSTSQTVGAVSLVAGSITGDGTLAAASFAVQQGTISPTLAGSGATLTKTGSGTVVLHGAAAYTGLTSVQAGTLTLAADDRFTSSSAIEIMGGTAHLSLGSTSQVAGAITLVSGQISGGTLSATSVNAMSGTINTVLAGSGGLTKTTDGFVTLSGIQTYTGNTVISGGTLSVTDSLGNTNITVGNLGALRTGVTTTLAGMVTVNDTGIVNVGGSGTAGTLTAGAMTFNAGSVLLFDLEQDSVNLGGNSLTAAGMISYGGMASVGQTYTLFTGVSSLTGSFATGTTPAGVGSATYGFDAGTLTVTFAARVGYISMTGADYVQNFNTLAMSGSNSSLPDGFYFAESGGGSANNGLYNAGTGSSNAGDTYSFGQTNSTDRAIGGVASSSLQTSFGFALQNDTGAEIEAGQMKISYVGERWRVGGAAADRLDFQYSLDATSLTTGTWVDVDSLDFTTVGLAVLATGETDGNLVGNQKLIEDVLNVSIANGSTLWIRWVDPDVTGGDDGLAIDNLVVSVPEPASVSLLALGGMGLLRRRRRTA